MTAFNADALNALTKLFNCQTAASDIDIIKCTLTIVWFSKNLDSTIVELQKFVAVKMQRHSR